MSSRTALRKSLGLERLHLKVNKQQTAATLELWVLYQQLKVAAAADAANLAVQQLVDKKLHETAQRSRPESFSKQLRPLTAGTQRQPASTLSPLQPAEPGSHSNSLCVPAVPTQHQRQKPTPQASANSINVLGFLLTIVVMFQPPDSRWSDLSVGICKQHNPV